MVGFDLDFLDDSAEAALLRGAPLEPDRGGLSQQALRLDTEVARLASVQSGLERAQILMAQGFITEPEEANAVAVLREVERLDPGSDQTALLLQQAAERLAAVAQEAYSVGMTEDAQQYLELALTVTPDISAWRELRASWNNDSITQ